MHQGIQFEQEIKARFNLLCRARDAAKYHSEKRRYLNKIDAVLDSYLDWRAIQGL